MGAASRSLVTAFVAAVCLAAMAAPAASAATWLPPVDVSPAGQSASGPKLATGDGQAIVVWQRTGAQAWSVMASLKPVGGVFGAPVELAKPGNSPSVAMSPSGAIVVAYTASTGGKSTILARVRPPGGEFGPPQTVAVLGSGFSVAPEVDINDAGDIAVVWLNRVEGNGVAEVATRPAGGSFAEPVALSDAEDEASGVRVAVARDGEASVVFQALDGDALAIFHAGGEGNDFGPTELLSSDANAFHPQVAIGPDDEPRVVWSGAVAPPPEGDPEATIRMARRSGGSFQTPVALSDEGERSLTPALEINASGTTVVAWLLKKGIGHVVQSRTMPAGGSFGPAADLTAETVSAERLRLSLDDAGSTLVGWQRTGPTAVFARMRPPDGEFGPEAMLSPIDGTTFNSELAVDSTLGAVAIWMRDLDSSQVVQATGYDDSAPQLRDLSVPATGTVGVPVSFSVNPFDSWSTRLTSFDFGDGVSADGASVEHTYGSPGTYSVSVSTVDFGGVVSAAVSSISIVPSYGFGVGKQRPNAQRGIVNLVVNVSGPGRVTVRGKPVRPQTRDRKAAGKVTIPVIARGKALARLNRSGKSRVQVIVGFRPVGGDRAAQKRISVVLKKKTNRKTAQNRSHK